MFRVIDPDTRVLLRIRRMTGILILAVVCIALWVTRGDLLVRSLYTNLALNETATRLIGHVEPLSLRDLLGQDDRYPGHDFDGLIEKVTGIWQSSSDMGRRAHLFRLSNTLFLLEGQPGEVVVNASDMGTDDLSLYLLATAYSQQRRPAEVKATLQRIPGSSSLLANAGREAWSGRPDSYVDLVIASLEMALSLEKTVGVENLDIYQTLSYAHERAGNRVRAIEIAKLWREEAPRDCVSNTWLSALYLKDGKPEEAYGVLQRLDSLGGSGCLDFAGQMAQVFIARGKIEEAVVLYQLEAERQPENPYVHWYLAKALAQANRDAEALTHLRSLLQLDQVPSDLYQSAEALWAKLSSKLMP